MSASGSSSEKRLSPMAGAMLSLALAAVVGTAPVIWQPDPDRVGYHAEKKVTEQEVVVSKQAPLISSQVSQSSEVGDVELARVGNAIDLELA